VTERCTARQPPKTTRLFGPFPRLHSGTADGCGRIVTVALTPGNIADITMAVPILKAFAPAKLPSPTRPMTLIACALGIKGIEAVIPGRATRAVVYPLNRTAYRRRNVIERMFGRLKNWKRIATRYDRLAINYLAAIVLVATISQWLGCVPYPVGTMRPA
jgi:transposase